MAFSFALEGLTVLRLLFGFNICRGRNVIFLRVVLCIGILIVLCVSVVLPCGIFVPAVIIFAFIPVVVVVIIRLESVKDRAIFVGLSPAIGP